jgi:hypothetical protein
MPLIRNFVSVPLTLTAALFLSLAPANAKTLSYFKKANSGKSQWIDAYFGWNDDCSFRTIGVDVISKPSHGTVTPKIEIQKIVAAHVGSAGKCAGKKTKAVAVYYRSKSGYRGTDKFKIRMTLPGFSPVYYNYTVNVR